MKFSLKIILPLLILIVVSCKKDHSVLGVDVQPSSDDLNAENISDLPVTAHSLPYDSVATFNDQFKFIGSNNDPHFGRTDIGLYLNPTIGVSNLDFGANSTISSAEIILKVDPTEYAGDKNASLTYSVFPVTSVLTTSIIYTNETRHHSQTPLSVYTGTYGLSEDGQTIIKIAIDPVYATGLLHDTPHLVSNDIFQAAYKGYYIATSLQSGSEGVIFKADVANDLSGLWLHYKTGSAPTDTITHFRFAFTGSSPFRYNTVKFTPKQILKDQFLDSTLGATNLYLKGMGVSRLKIQIPFLKNYSDSFQVAVNRAELILYIDPSFTISTSRYYVPPKLVLLSIDSLGRETYLQDLLTSADYSRYDGKFDEANGRYVFNLAREAQLIFEGKKKNRGFYLVVSDADFLLKTVYEGNAKELVPVRRDSYYQRVVFAGANNFNLKPRFNLNYIRFKND